MRITEKQLLEYMDGRIDYWREKMNVEKKQYQYEYFVVYVIIKDVIFGANNQELAELSSVTSMMQTKMGFEKNYG